MAIDIVLYICIIHYHYSGTIHCHYSSTCPLHDRHSTLWTAPWGTAGFMHGETATLRRGQATDMMMMMMMMMMMIIIIVIIIIVVVVVVVIIIIIIIIIITWCVVLANRV